MHCLRRGRVYVYTYGKNSLQNFLSSRDANKAEMKRCAEAFKTEMKNVRNESVPVLEIKFCTQKLSGDFVGGGCM